MMESLNHSSTDQDIKKVRLKKIFFGLGIVIIAVILLLNLGIYLFLRPFPGKTNILILGVAGENHAAGDLTDTIIFLSVDHQTGKVLFLFLPRDIWVPALRTKLNSVYHYQEMKGTKQVISDILKQPVDYGVLINFDVFTKIIDTLGGVEVDVERSFDDYRYPIPGKGDDFCEGDPEYKCRYEHLHFEAGSQHMDGERALKYIRSRFAEGEEGSDFARSKRQQRLLIALKNKIFSFQTFSNPKKMVQSIKVIFESIETDIPQDKYFDFVKVASRFRSKNMKIEVLNDDRLINPPPSKVLYDGQWVLIPRAGDWKEIQEYVVSLMEE